MNQSDKIVFLFLFIGFSLFNSCTNNNKSQDQWIQLFNGENLNNWTVKIRGFEVGENYKNTYRVEDGLLKVSYDGYDKFENHFGNLFYNQKFASFRLHAEYRFTGEQMADSPEWAYLNNGIMIFGQTPESMEIDQSWPTCIEVQLLGSDSTHLQSNLNVCTPGTNIVMNGELILEHTTLSGSTPSPEKEWITVDIEVKNDTIKHFLNGELVLLYSKPQLDERDRNYSKLLPDDGDKMLHEGTISIQAEGHPIEFRKIELQVLD